MNKLFISPAKGTFGIHFDPKRGIFEISGNSFPPNAMEFFEPIIEWVNKFLSDGPEEPISIIFKVNYFNTSSSKYIYKILELFHKNHEKYKNVKLLWHTHDSEDELYEDWRSLIQDLDLPHEIILKD